MSKLSDERDRLHALLQKQLKQHKRFEGHAKGSPKRASAKIALHRLRGLIATVQAVIANLIRKRDQGPRAAVRWALSQQGQGEHPDGSNWGHPVQDWIEHTGYTSPEPWCGCFVHEAVVVHGHAKIPTGVHLGYGPAIIHDAESHQNGLVAVPFSSARPGDIAVLWGGEHVTLVRGNPSSTTVPTIEGNTSPNSSGSQYNGGIVAAKTRSRSDVSVIARPAY